MNVEVLHASSRQLPLEVEFGERVELGESFFTHCAAKFTNAAEQSLSRGAEGSISPAIVLVPGTPLLPLQPPLQPIIHYPPDVVELGYEAIGGVRWTLRALLVVSMPCRCF